MQLNWSTLLLEVLNFLVLIWILKRFLYRPVLDVIARRRHKLQQTLEAAKAERSAAELLQRQYEARLTEWQREKAAAGETLQRELGSERERRLQALQTELENERKKAQVLEQRARGETKRRLEAQALELGARFASRLLTRVAGPAVESKLVDVTLEDLTALPGDQRELLSRLWREATGPIEVSSGYPLDETRREALVNVFANLTGERVSCRYRQDTELIAGLRLRIGPWLMKANLRDELRSFAEAGRE